MMISRLRLAASALCLAAITFTVTVDAYEGETRVYKDQGFSIVIPKGFKEMAPEEVPPSAFAAFYLENQDPTQPNIAISLQDLGGLIEKGHHIKDSDLPQEYRDAGMRVGQITWNGHTVDTLITEMQNNGLEVVSAGAQVPIEPRAIQVNLAMPALMKEKHLPMLTSIVATLKGPTNWDAAGPPPAMASGPLSSDSRIERLTMGIGQLAFVIILVLGGVRLLRGKKR